MLLWQGNSIYDTEADKRGCETYGKIISKI